MAFEDTVLKRRLREVEDLGLIQSFHDAVSPSISRKFRYFGLPGRKILDLESWSAYLGEITAVEEKKGYIPEMLATAKKLRILERTTILEGRIEDVLIEGFDQAKVRPRFPYDIVNMDFEGGLLMKDGAGRSRKVEGLRMLFAKQEDEAVENTKIPISQFLLFLSIGSRENPEVEYDDWWKSLLDANTPSVAKQLEKWKSSLPLDFLLRKPYITDLVRRLAGDKHFDCETSSVHTYLGHEDTRMMRFAFLCRFVSRTDISLAHKQSFETAFGLPLKECLCEGEEIRIVEHRNEIPGIESPT